MGIFSKDKKIPENILVKGKQLKCRICDNSTFYSREAKLNTTTMSIMNLDWADKSATCYVCSNCMHIEWFLENN